MIQYRNQEGGGAVGPPSPLPQPKMSCLGNLCKSDQFFRVGLASCYFILSYSVGKSEQSTSYPAPSARAGTYAIYATKYFPRFSLQYFLDGSPHSQNPIRRRQRRRAVASQHSLRSTFVFCSKYNHILADSPLYWWFANWRI